MLIPNIASICRVRACMYDIWAPIFMIWHCFARLYKKFGALDFWR